MFNGNLSPGELLAIRRAGFVPLEVALGVAVYRFSAQLAAGQQMSILNLDVHYLTHAISEARSRALSRLNEEATRMGAEYVVGTSLSLRDLGDGMIEFSAIGTGIHRPDKPASAPKLSALSGTDFVQLLQSGFEPVNIVFGVSVFMAITLETITRANGMNQSLGAFTTGVRPDLSDLLNRARETAFGSLLQEARKADCEGVVGTCIEERRCLFAPEVVEFYVSGTAVRRRYFPDPKVDLALSLQDNG